MCVCAFLAFVKINLKMRTFFRLSLCLCFTTKCFHSSQALTHSLSVLSLSPLKLVLFLTCMLNKFCCHKYKCHTFICYHLAPGRGQGNPEGVKQRVLLLFSLLQSTFSACPSRTLALKTLHCLLSMHIKVIPGSSLRTQIQLAVENFLWSGLY